MAPALDFKLALTRVIVADWKTSCYGMFIFARFHARAGQENAVEQALRDVAAHLAENHVFRWTRELRLYYIQSRWRDEAAFDTHAGLAHTVRFLNRWAAL